MDIHEVVMRLAGPITPVGETYTDDSRFENLKAVTKLVDQLLFDINDVAKNEVRIEFSMNRAGKFAAEFLREVAAQVE